MKLDLSYMDVGEKYPKAFQFMVVEDPYLYHYLSGDGPGKKGLGSLDYEDIRTLRSFCMCFTMLHCEFMQIWMHFVTIVIRA